jgi:Leucine-rich repeat (LRR) protein
MIYRRFLESPGNYCLFIIFLLLLLQLSLAAVRIVKRGNEKIIEVTPREGGAVKGYALSSDTFKTLPDHILLREATNLVLVQEDVKQIQDSLATIEALAEKGFDVTYANFATNEHGQLVVRDKDVRTTKPSSNRPFISQTDRSSQLSWTENRESFQTSTADFSSILFPSEWTTDISSVMARERDILQTFFTAARVPNYMKREWKWMGDENDPTGVANSYCQWRGVYCETKEYRNELTNVTVSRQSNSNLPPLEVVTKLELAGFNLEGTVPAYLAGLQWLRVLDLAGNALVGTIPDDYGNWTLLEKLDVSNNNITGSIPHQLRAKDLRLATNRLTGTIPSFLSQLQILDLSENFLTGTLGSEIATMTDLEVFLFGNNLIHGTIPRELENLTKLEILDGGSNALEDSMDELISIIPKSVRDINLGDNLIMGSIPSGLLSLSSLEILILSDNMLSGRLPGAQSNETDAQQRWTNLAAMRALILNGNSISGSLPIGLFVGLNISIMR